MKVKLKVKHLILIVSAMVGLAFGLLYWVIPNIQIARATSDPLEEEENVFKLLRSGKLPDYKETQLIEDYVINVDYYNGYDIKTGGALTENGSSLLSKTRIGFVKQYVEQNPSNEKKYYIAISQLAYYYAKQGKFESAHQLLDDTLNTMDKSMENFWELTKVKLEIMAKVKPNQALEEINKALESGYLTGEYTELMVNILLSQEKYEEALRAIEYIDKEQLNNYLHKHRRNLDNWIAGESLHTVTGKIATADGNPIPFARVYLRLPNTINQSIVERNEIYVTTTDQNGAYTIGGVPTGNYQVNVGVDLDQIEGFKWGTEPNDLISVVQDVKKNITWQPLIEVSEPSNFIAINSDQVKFEWSQVEDAAYYQLFFGIEKEEENGFGQYSGGFPKRFTSNKVTIGLEELYDCLPFVLSEDGSSPDGRSLLMFTNPNEQFFWYVQAYTENGDLITSSQGYRLTRDLAQNVPYFKLQQRELTEEDQLLLDGNVERALNGYQQILEDDPENTHALRMTKRITEHDDWETREQGKVDALPYTIKLAELTNNPTYWLDAANVSFDHEKWEEYFSYYEKYTEAMEGNFLNVNKGNYAVALMKTGDVDRAEVLLKEIVSSDDTHHWTPEWTVLTLFKTNEFSKAIEIARQYPVRSIDNRNNWDEILLRVEAAVMESEKDKQMFEKGLELYMTGQELAFDTWLEEDAAGSIKALFKEL